MNISRALFGSGEPANLPGPSSRALILSSGSGAFTAAATETGVPSHTVKGVTWVDVDALSRQIGGNLDPREDIMAPVASMDLDSVRVYDGLHYISSPALVRRLRMNDRSRLFAIMNVRQFLDAAVGRDNVQVGVRIGDSHYVDIFVPNARLAIDVNSGTLASSAAKVGYLRRQGIYHIEFNSGVRGGLEHRRVHGEDNDDVDRLLNSTIPEIFMCLVSRYSIGSPSDSASAAQFAHYAENASIQRQKRYLARPDRVYISTAPKRARLMAPTPPPF